MDYKLIEKVNTCKSNIYRWFKDEDGFIVFESTALMLGGVALAIGIGIFALFYAGREYLRAEVEFVGNESEATDALDYFTPPS